MLPEKFMLPDELIPDVRDQKKCDICVAMAITAVLQIIYYKKTGKREQFSPTWGAVMWRRDVDGQKNMASLNPDSAIPAMIEAGAVFTEDCPELLENPEAYKYVMAHPELQEKVIHLVEGFEKINNGSREARVEAIKTAVYENMLPVVAVVKEKKSSHCVPIIGWEDGKELFYVMNSWGKGIDTYKYEDLKKGYKLIPTEDDEIGGDGNMIKIALDAGHGLYTSGKQTPDGIKEWTLNDKVRDKVVDILLDYDCEIMHTDNNEGATDESLASRVKKYKEAGVAAFVSIHHNAYTGTWNNATGVEVFTDKNPTAADLRLADCIMGRLARYTGLSSRGIKQANFAVINQNKIPAVLCEGGFMDGTKDYEVITSEEGQLAYARAVAEGLVEFLGLKKKEGVKVDKFTDIKDHWCREDINEAAEIGIINGRGDGTFGPDEPITRAEAVAMIMRSREK